MSLAPIAHDSLNLLDLYGAEDMQAFQQALSRTLSEHCGAEVYAVHLLDRRRRRFLELESTPGAAASLEGARGLQLPLQVGGEDLGVLSLPAGVEHDEGALAALGSHVAMALYYRKFIEQQGQLIDESLAHVQALKAMGELLGELDQDLVLTKTLKFFVDLLDAEVGAAVLREGERAVAEARWGLPADLLLELVAAVDQGLVESEGSFQRVRLPRGRFSGFSLATVLHLPIALKAPHSVHLFLVSGESLAVSQQPQELIASCQTIGGIALQKALDHLEQIRQHRFDEQLQVAKEIQRKLLPAELPRLPDLDIAGVSLPALAVGGDYYDVLTLPGGDLLAIVADVSGKGIQAAIRMSGLQAMTHSLVHLDPSPGEVLLRLNQLLGEGGLSGHFVTASILRIERGGRRVRLASAGHEAILRASGDGETCTVEAPGGLPLGLRGEQDYPEMTLELEPGDRLLVYTDGMTDTRNAAGELFGSERLGARLAEASGDSAAAMLECLVADLETYRGELPWPDDLTALTLHYHAEGKH